MQRQCNYSSATRRSRGAEKGTTKKRASKTSTNHRTKRQHRKAYRVDIVDGEETHIGYFKRPDFATIKAVTKLAKTDEVEAGKVMMDNCWLGGSEELRKDAVLFMAVQAQLGGIA
ncbi:hypothetical protein [uncultured Muribaculum sp.]|uniref:hypothetical protein n=1 Tax=uncultured Muribaculum sp. TaxID=1918613 RepID=UPI00259168F5|nr:hypothetical protein [uncultured Muribaculum sp.]